MGTTIRRKQDAVGVHAVQRGRGLWAGASHGVRRLSAPLDGACQAATPNRVTTAPRRVAGVSGVWASSETLTLAPRTFVAWRARAVDRRPALLESAPAAHRLSSRSSTRCAQRAGQDVACDWF